MLTEARSRPSCNSYKVNKPRRLSSDHFSYAGIIMRRPNAGGFIFMEVILTLAILTVGAVATFQSYRLSMRAFHESHERFEAGLLLERQLGEYEKTRLLNRTLATDSFLNPVTWTDEVVRTDP